MKRNFVLFTAFALTAFGSSASACCLFPFFPTYSAGYPSFGLARPIIPASNYYSASYAPSYGYYGGQSFAGSNCGTGCCDTGYTTNYPSFPITNSCGGCNTGCGQCNSGCGQCQTGFGQYSAGFGTINGCASGNCAGLNCIGTEIRSRPEPDSEFDRRESDPRTFENDRDSDLDRRDDFDYDRRNPDTIDRRDPMDNDSFNRPDPLDSREDWNPAGNGRRGTDPLGDTPLRNDDLNGGRSPSDFSDPNDFLGRKPPLDNEAIAPNVDPMNEPINRSSRKPPMSAPVEAEPADGSSPIDIDRDPTDVLPKADDSNTKTTSLREGRSFVRFAGFSSGQQKSTTNRISSSRSKQRAPRWISLPAPIGRVRL